MVRLLGLVISIGLADSMNPSTIAPGLLFASGKDHPRRKVLEFTLGVLATYLLGGLILVLGPGQAILSLLPHPGATTRYILETIAGAVVLAVGIYMWSARHRPGRHKQEDEGEGSQESRWQRSPAILGVTITIVELPTAFPYFAAIAAIVGSGENLVDRLIALAIYNGCFVLPLIAIWGLLWLFPNRAADILTRIRDFLRRHWRTIVAVIALIAGAFVLTLGATGLIGQGHGSDARTSRKIRHFIQHG